MNINRRNFLGLAALAAAAGGCRVFTGAASDFDDNLSVFLSDLHCNGTQAKPAYQRDNLARVVAEILKLDPLPRRCLCFGDFAYLFGPKGDYAKTVELMRPLFAAGIQVFLGMGNHDKRNNFLEFYPDYAKTSPVPGRIVSDISLGACDFLLLDSLDEAPGEGWNPVPGKIEGAQLEWLEARVKGARKPFFAGAHHPMNEVKINKLLCESSLAAGYIHGHNHKWYHQFCQTGRYNNPHVVRTACLPSTGHWGDIGFSLFRTYPDRAVLTVRQLDFFFPEPLPAAKRPRAWDQIVQEHDGDSVTFFYA